MMTIERGAITVKFQTLEEVAEAMLYLATVFTHDLEGFAELYEPELEVPEEQATTMDESRTEVAFYRDWQPTGKQWKG